VIGAVASWLAISSLLKLIPGSGNGGAAACATTFAFGRATTLYFESRPASFARPSWRRRRRLQAGHYQVRRTACKAG